MIKSILGGKSKNLCDVAYLLTLPVDKNFERYGFWEVEISVEPNTVYTFSRENANQINVGSATYLGITNRYDIPNGSNSQWLNHETLPGLCHQNVQITAGAEGKLWIFFSANIYKKWQNHGNLFGYLQLELGSTATEYVPHELTSYKSIMKVSDVMQVVDKPVSSTGVSLVGKSQTISGITCHYLEDGTGVTLTGTTSTAYATFEFGVYKKPIIGHKYLWFYQHSNASDVINRAYIELKYVDKDGKSHWFGGNEQVYTLSEYAEKFKFHSIVKDNTTCNEFTFKPQLFDLTEMFGAGNEPKTVAEFKAKFPNDYYQYSPSCFVTSFDERMPCKTKNLIDSQQIYQISQHMNVTIWQGEVNYVCTFSYELAMFETNDGAAALFEFAYSDGTYSYITHRDKYKVLSQITDSKKLTKIRLFNWSDVKGILSNIQLEKGTTPTDYVPYGYV